MTALYFICSYPQLVGVLLILLYGLWRYSSAKGADQRTDWLVAMAAIHSLTHPPATSPSEL